MDTYLRRRVDEDYAPEPLNDVVFGQYTERFLLQSFEFLDRWGILPEPGGLNNQEMHWVEAMINLSRLNGQVQHEYRLWKLTHGGS